MFNNDGIMGAGSPGQGDAMDDLDFEKKGELDDDDEEDDTAE